MVDKRYVSLHLLATTIPMAEWPERWLPRAHISSPLVGNIPFIEFTTKASRHDEFASWRHKNDLHKNNYSPATFWQRIFRCISLETGSGGKKLEKKQKRGTKGCRILGI